MLTVIKKRGNKQPFDRDKIKTSINNAARDAELIITSKEADLMSQDVERHITAIRGKDGVTNSYEIRAMVRLVLQEFGFPKIVQFFERGKLADMTDIDRHRQAIAEHQAALAELLREQGEPELSMEDRDVAPRDMTDEEDVETPLEDVNIFDLKTEHYKNRDR